MTNDEFIRRAEALRPVLYRVCRVQLSVAADREDAIQEAVFLAWHRRDTLRDARYFNTWLIRILINACHDIRRRRRQNVLTDAPPEPPGNDDPRLAALRDALNALNDRQRLWLAVGLNLFELFGKHDTRLSQIADATRLGAGTWARVDTEEMGASRAGFDSAYYDGKTLIAAYTVENHSRVERFEPTDEWLREATPWGNPTGLAHWDGADSAILDEFDLAISRGEPFGFVHYTLEPNDHCETEDGVELPPLTEYRNVTPDGKLCGLREFETPLPEAAQDRESLELHMTLKLFTARFYYDGERAYAEYENRDAGEIVAAVARTESVTRRFAGEGSINGIPVHVEAQASAVHATVSVVAEGRAFPDPKELYPEADALWYEPFLEDDNGLPMYLYDFDVHADSAAASFTGNGRLPEQLRLFIGLAGEGDWWHENMEKPTPILLTPAA